MYCPGNFKAYFSGDVVFIVFWWFQEASGFGFHFFLFFFFVLSLDGASCPGYEVMTTGPGDSEVLAKHFGVPRARRFLHFRCRSGYGSKRKPLGTTGFGLFFLLPIGFFGYPFLTHSQVFQFPQGVWGHLGDHPTVGLFLVQGTGALPIARAIAIQGSYSIKTLIGPVL